MVQSTGFIIVRVQIPCVVGYDEDRVAIVLDDPGMKECRIILGMPTLYRVMEVIKESEISTLAMPWGASRISWLMREMQAHIGRVVHDDVANKPISLNTVDEVREHLKLMLDAGAICPSNSPWCNAVVLVRKKDGSLCFCIDFRRLNALTKKDSHPLPHICEMLDSLVGFAYYSTFDLTSRVWQVPMDEESKQFTAFTLGSTGLYECERMPFGLCNTSATFQRLMQNCLGELNLTYCLIYLDDVIVYSKTPAEHLQRMRVVFDCLRMHGLKLKPSKCELFKTEINYLAHHVSKAGVLPSKKNLVSIAECTPPTTYTGIKSFVGLVGHYHRFIKGFAQIAAPLYDLISGDNSGKKKESV